MQTFAPTESAFQLVGHTLFLFFKCFILEFELDLTATHHSLQAIYWNITIISKFNKFISVVCSLRGPVPHASPFCFVFPDLDISLFYHHPSPLDFVYLCSFFFKFSACSCKWPDTLLVWLFSNLYIRTFHAQHRANFIFPSLCIFFASFGWLIVTCQMFISENKSRAQFESSANELFLFEVPYEFFTNITVV